MKNTEIEVGNWVKVFIVGLSDKNEKLYFLESIERQVHSRGSLSIKQRKALNKMYTQFTKKIEKIKKSA